MVIPSRLLLWSSALALLLPLLLFQDTQVANAQTQEVLVKADMDALLALQAANPRFSQYWTSSSPCSRPSHVTCNNSRVQKIIASCMNGTIPSQLGNMTALQVLKLDAFDCPHDDPDFGQSLQGSIPPELWRLKGLTVLSLSQNYELSGVLPPDLGSLTALRTLDLYSTKLKGSIPSTIGQLTSLEYLAVSVPKGPVPAEIGNLTALETLILDTDNTTLPESIANLTRLRELALYSAGKPAGQLPSQIGKLKDLTRFVFRNARHPNFFVPFQDSEPKWPSAGLSGPIPAGLGALTLLGELDLSYNNLSGPIPDLNRLNNLTEMDLSNNRLTGPVPQVSSLAVFNNLLLGQNQLSGPLPPFLFNSSYAVYNVDLSMNALTGQFPRSTPPSLGKESIPVGTLNLSWNQLSGPIPPWFIKTMPTYYQLSLNNNNFSGELADAFPSLENSLARLLVGNFDLKLSGHILSLAANKLSGPIPASIGNLNFAHLNLSSNRFNGSLPVSLAQLPNTAVIDLSNNELTGPIPPGIFAINSTEKYVDCLLLNNNKFTDPLAFDSSQAVPFGVLHLGGNNFSKPSSFPKMFKGCCKLLYIDFCNWSLSPADIDSMCTDTVVFVGPSCIAYPPSLKESSWPPCFDFPGWPGPNLCLSHLSGTSGQFDLLGASISLLVVGLGLVALLV